MKKNRPNQELRARGLVRAAAWLLLVLTILPPLHLIFPDGGCGGSGGEDGAAIRPGHSHSLLDCRLCQELLLASAMPGPSAPTAGTSLLAGTAGQTAAERFDVAPLSRSWSPRAPPALLG